MAEFELHGFLTTGKFNVNDYTIEIERVAGGLRMTIDDGSGSVQSAIIKDGEPGLTEAERAKMLDMYEKLTKAFPEWKEAEEARQAAEKKREAAENGPNSDKTKYRAGLYELMLALYNKLYPKIDEDLKAAENAKKAAETARDKAQEAAKQAASVSLGDLASEIYYKSGDKILFGHTSASALNQSKSLNATGYVDGGRDYIHVKIPVAKRLDKIKNFSIARFKVFIANSAGHAMGSSAGSGGDDFASYVTYTYVDKVQNCLHLQLKRSSDWDLRANECVSVRIGDDAASGSAAVEITLN